MIRSMEVVMPTVAGVRLSLTTPAVMEGWKAALSLGSDADLESYLKPNSTDYIHVPIRALSAAPVQGGIFDFSHKGGAPLKAAVPLFNGLTVFKDHNTQVSNWLGKTSAAYWDEVTPGVPFGVNMMLDVDVKADPKIARGLVSGALDSGSVTIKFDYEQSHPDMDPEDFFWKLGEKVDGQQVRALVTNITRCMEYSVVWQGADQFAKVISDDGKIYTPGSASNSFTHRKQEKRMDLKALAVLLGLTALGDNVTEATVSAAITAQNLNVATLTAGQTALAELTITKTKLAAAETQVTELTASVTKLTTEAAVHVTQVTTLQAKVAELTPQAATGLQVLTKSRSEALRLYNLVEGDKATEAMRSVIGNADLAVADSFVTSYTARAEQIAPNKCVKCGGTEFSRATAQHTTDLPPVNDASMKTFENSRFAAGLESIHGKPAAK